ncbi:hypothetical protein [Flavobacterium sp. H122]|uniref:hypothetical protein n=1 Tax=Flavobacterium sp. H122 TaxID=2529860 RepID=UPI0010AA0EAE|nr:hypothetical protein [Flavobacterium sp. H122]
MKKINIKIVLAQCVSLIFLINGIKRLILSSQAEKYKCLIDYFQNNESNCWKQFQSQYKTMANFIVFDAYFALYGFIIGIILIGVINWQNKKSPIYITSVLFIVLIPFATGILKKGIINNTFNTFGGLFSNDFGVKNLIGGIFFTLIGLLISWKSAKWNTSTTHNSGLD